MLREASSTFKSGKFAVFYDHVKSEASMMFGWHPDDMAESELTPRCVRQWIVSHRKLFSRRNVTVYRAMNLTDQQVADLKPGSELGPHWAFELNPHNFGDFDIGSATNVVVFTATVTARDVNFPLSVAYNCLFPHESELFMDRYATFVLKSVRRYWFHTDQFTEEERPDLIGKTMQV